MSLNGNRTAAISLYSVAVTSGSASEAPTEIRTASRWQWLARHWPALATLLVAAPLVLYTTLATIDWFGLPFPGFFLLSNDDVATVGLYEWTGLEAGVPFHARVIAVDERPVRTSADVYAYARAWPLGTPIRYTFVKGEQTFTRTVPTMPFGARDYWMTVGSYLVNGFILIGVAALISLLNPTQPRRASFWSLDS